jgi:hypothetical protein
MNRYFDFTPKQIKFLAVLTFTALIMGGYLFVRSYTVPTINSPDLQVFVGESEPEFAYRQLHRFEKEIDIINVKGIGPRTYERLKPYLKIKAWTTTPISEPE